MTTPPARRSLRDRLILGGLRLVPAALARHVMFLLQTQPGLADEWGYHVRAIHYYDPLPDFRTITEAATMARRVSPAIDFNLAGQQALLRRLGDAYGAEVAAVAERFDFRNEYFAGLDAALYYALIRDLKPRRVIEIGSGFSTRIADLALRRNRTSGHAGDLVCIEPFPQARLLDAKPTMTLIEQPVEQVPLEVFDALEANDILFIDSSHAVKFGGDVCREFLEILPRLKPGVWVHVHDIFFPGDYPARWLVGQRRAFNEQYLLEAFLAFNPQFAVRAANHWLGQDHAALVAGLCPPALVPAGDHGTGSFWMQRTLAP
ncbi:MAG: class I SAM-dependent methyltransferase [Acidobacteriota bacterium]|nr:class I SAM-dependent methyltransferase [Acidobacteriota bacterium]